MLNDRLDMCFIYFAPLSILILENIINKKMASNKIVIELYFIKYILFIILFDISKVVNSVRYLLNQVISMHKMNPIISFLVGQFLNRLYFLIMPPIKYSSDNQITLYPLFMVKISFSVIVVTTENKIIMVISNFMA